MQLEISLTSSLKGHLTPEVMTAYSDLNEFKVALVLIVAVTIVSKVHEVSTKFGTTTNPAIRTWLLEPLHSQRSTSARDVGNSLAVGIFDACLRCILQHKKPRITKNIPS
jgi:hypothetical protein